MSHHLPQLSLRPAVDGDLSWLLKLRLRTMAQHIARSGEELSVKDQRDRVLYRYDCIHIVELDAVPVGMMKVIRNEVPWQLVQIQVRPENQGQGIGERLVRQLLDDGKRQGVAVSLHVLKVNPAKNLYGRLGFTVVADRGHSYEMQWDA